MIDIHSHILPGADHGVQSHEEAWKIVIELYNLGFTKLVFTPHLDLGKNLDYLEHFSRLFKSFNESNKEIKLKMEVFLGSEVALCTELIEKNPQFPLTFIINDKTLQLIEIHPLLHPVAIDAYISYAKMYTINPIIAHIERLDKVVNDSKLREKLKNAGFKFQVDIMSFSGQSDSTFEENAKKLLYDGEIDLLATDCHSIHDMNKIKAGLEFIQNRIPEWKILFTI